jgi:hypothetical protein
LIRHTTIPFGVISMLRGLALPNIKKCMKNRVAVVSLYVLVLIDGRLANSAYRISTS